MDNKEESNLGGLENSGLTVHLQGRQFWYIIWTLPGVTASYTFNDIITSHV